jgi:hypothetical protein
MTKRLIGLAVVLQVALSAAWSQKPGPTTALQEKSQMAPPAISTGALGCTTATGSATAATSARKRAIGGPAQSGDDDDTSDLDVERVTKSMRATGACDTSGQTPPLAKPASLSKAQVAASPLPPPPTHNGASVPPQSAPQPSKAASGPRFRAGKGLTQGPP